MEEIRRAVVEASRHHDAKLVIGGILGGDDRTAHALA